MLRSRSVVYFILACTSIAAAVVGSPTFAQTIPNDFTVEGRLYDGGGTPKNSTVEVMLEVISDSSPANCVLYRETFTNVNVASSDPSAQGLFALSLGTGSQDFPVSPIPRPNLTTLFSSGAVLNGINEVTSAGCSVTPSASEHRVVRVKVRDLPTDPWDTLSPDTKVTAAPTSMVADSANTFQGHDVTEFILTNTSTSLNQANVNTVFTNANYAALLALLNGTSTQYVGFGATTIDMGAKVLTNLATPVGNSDAVTKNYADTKLAGSAINLSGLSAGKVLGWNGTAWVAQTVSGISSLTTGTGLTGGVITTTGTISVDVGTGANQIVSLTSAAQLPAIDSFLLTNLNALTGLTGDVTTVGGAHGSVAATIANDAITSAKIKSSGGGVNRLLITDASTGGAVGYSTCSTNGEVLQWTPSGWACATVATFLGTSGVTAGTYANSTQVAQITVDAQGRVTQLTNVNINFPVTSVNGKTGGALTLNGADLGLGTAANYNVGTAINNIVQLDGAAKLPGVDGSQLTAVSASSLQGRAVASNTPAAGQSLVWNGTTTNWEPRTTIASDITGALGFTPLAASGTTVNLDMNGKDIVNLGNMIMNTGNTLKLGSLDTTSEGSLTLTLGTSDKGKTWYNTTTNEIRFWNGSAVSVLGVAGAGLTSLNGLTNGSQTFATPGTSGLAPGWSSAGSIHTLNIPMASTASVSAGLISNTQYTTLNSKVSSQWITTGSDIYYNTGKVGVGLTTPSAQVDISGSNASGTLRVYDQTASTGATRVIVQAGAGQSSTKLQEWLNVGGSTVASVSATGVFTGDGSGLTSISTNSIGSGSLSVSRGGTGLSSGTAGGIPYFASPTSMLSSAALAQYELVIGGGGGSAPSTIGSVGTAGTFLMSNGSAAPSWSSISVSGVTGTLPIANGGTSATTAAAARTNLGAATSGVNSDITSLTGITGNVTATGGNFSYSGSSGTFQTSTGSNTFMGDSTVASGKNLAVLGGARTGSPSLTGQYFSVGTTSFTDSATAASGTASNMAFNSIAAPTLIATNSTVTTTNAYSYYLAGAPQKGTNNTATNAIALGIGAGSVGAQTNSYGLFVNAQTGATNNYAAAFNGSVGIGTNAPTTTLDVYGSATNATSSFVQRTRSLPVAAASGTYSSYAQKTEMYPNVNSGITNSGGDIGSYLAALRGTSASDNGSQVSVTGMRIDYGHNNTGAPTPSTTSSYGLWILPYGKAGTLSNMYDLYIDNTITGGTVTNHWGLYQADSGVRNYFAGSLGIGAATPGSALDLNGAFTFRSMSAPSVSSATQARIYLDSTSNTLMVSQNGGPYAGLATLGSPTFTGTITANGSGTGLAVTNNETIGGALSVTSGIYGTGNLSISGTGTFNNGMSITGAALNMNSQGINNIGAIIGNGAMSIAAGGTNQNLLLSGSGTGAVLINPNIGIGTTTVTNLISIDGNSGTKAIAINRNSIASSPGANLSISAGGATSGGTDSSGGNLLLSSGTATGIGYSNIYFQTATPQSFTSATDNIPNIKMAINGSGLVGVGTSTPAYHFHVYSTSSLSGPTLDVQSTNNAVRSTMQTHNAGNQYTQIGTSGSAGGLGGAGSAYDNSTGYAGSTANAFNLFASSSGAWMGFFTNGYTSTEERMRITAAGNVGIGTTSPTSRLDVQGTLTIVTGSGVGVSETFNVNPPSAIIGALTIVGSQSKVVASSSSINMTSVDILAASNEARASGNQPVGNLYGTIGTATNASSSMVSNAIGLRGVVDNTGTSTIANSIGVFSLVQNTMGPSGTNAYGLFINNIQGNFVNKYAVYAPDASATSIFGGTVSIGTTSANYNTLEVNGSIGSNATSEGISTPPPSSPVSITTSGGVTVNANYNIARYTLAYSPALITLPTYNPSNSMRMYSLTVFVTQDGAGGRALNFTAPAGGTVKWDSAAMPPPVSTLGKTTVYQFMKPSDENVWYASMVWKEQ